MRLGLAAWKPHALPYRVLECVLLWLKDVTQLCEPPPGDTQVRGQLLVMTPEEMELPSRMAVFLRADDYVLELPQVALKKTYVLCHLRTDRPAFKGSCLGGLLRLPRVSTALASLVGSLAGIRARPHDLSRRGGRPEARAHELSTVKENLGRRDYRH
ncbi:MAG TPA: hypothetical protein VG099_27910 [Gemmataceae bacterium]|jgi:hypothetical protein|nr:hypothetical protein [Gemmataceae bacterium]